MKKVCLFIFTIPLVSIYLAGGTAGDFGKNIFNAIEKFQADNFEIVAADCVAEPVTSQALGVTFPLIIV